MPRPPHIPLFDKDGALSREYLLHRGTCCGNGCRNCPYGCVGPTRPSGKTPAQRRQDGNENAPTG